MIHMTTIVISLATTVALVDAFHLFSPRSHPTKTRGASSTNLCSSPEAGKLHENIPAPLNLDGLNNARDVSTSSSQAIRPGLIARSASPLGGQLAPNERGFKTLIDLRSPNELADDPNIELGVATPKFGRPWAPVAAFDGEMWTWVGGRGPELPPSSQEGPFELLHVSLLDTKKVRQGVQPRLRKRDRAKALGLAIASKILRQPRLAEIAKDIYMNAVNTGGLPFLNECMLEHSPASLRAVLEVFADPARHPICVFCTAGKVRGAFTCMLATCPSLNRINAFTKP